MSGRRVLVEMAKKMRTTLSAVLPVALLLAGFSASAQVDQGRIEPLYRDLQSSDWWIRQKAFETIQQNADYLKDPQTADRFLVLLGQLTQEIRRRYAAGLDSEGLGEGVLEATWGLWKERLSPEVFRVFASASYSANSRSAKEIGSRAGQFVSTLLPLTASPDKFLRENATALVGYALAEDQAGTARLTAENRDALRKALAAAATDPDYGVRIAAVRSLKTERDAWAVPLLERMYEREPSLHPAGDGQLPGEVLRSEMKEGIQAVRSRGQMPSQDFDELQAIYRDLQSNDPEVKSLALNALVRREDWLSFVDTPDRLLRVLEKETSAIRSLAALEKKSAAQGNTFYETLLATSWGLWKDRLTFPTFRVIAVSVYSSDSAFAKELGARSGPFAGMLWTPDSEAIPPQVRDNGLALLAYVLAGVEAGAVEMTPNMRTLAAKDIARAAEDRNPAIRLAVVNAAKLAGGAWAVPILEQMYEREASFDPSGRNRQSTEAFRGNVKAAIQSIQSRTGK
jgi:hypothetical protein